jgi:hypothetical protein
LCGSDDPRHKFDICTKLRTFPNAQIQFAAPKSTFGEEMFHAVAEAFETGSKQGKWPKLSWILVFQYPITELIAVIVLEATEATGTFCLSSLKPKFGHLWVLVIRLIGVVLAVITIIRFYTRMKTLMKIRRGAIKLFSFKGFVFLHFAQAVSGKIALA